MRGGSLGGGTPGATGATGPSHLTVQMPATLTTSLGTITAIGSQWRLESSLLVPANSIRIFFGAAYSASSSYWTWTPGYITPGSPGSAGSFTAIGSGRSHQATAITKYALETYTHSEVTIPSGSLLAVTCVPTNFPSPSTYGDHFFYFGKV